MPFCPKCEDEYQAGFDTCVDCQVTLVSKLGVSADPKKIEAAEEAYAAGVFEGHEEPVHFCPSCWNEFAVVGAQCAPCGGAVVTTENRPEFEAQVKSAPLIRSLEIDDLDTSSAQDLARIYVAKSPLEAGFVLDSLLGMGLDARVGHDGLDALAKVGRGPRSVAIENPYHLGIYIPADEEEAAEMLLPDSDEFEDDLGPAAQSNPYSRLLVRAEDYREYRKYHAAAEILAEAMAIDDSRPEAFLSLGLVAGRRGHIDTACTALEESLLRSGELSADQDGARSATGHRRNPHFDELYYLSALYHFLDDSGQLSYGGPRGDLAWTRLSEFVERRPRQVEAQLFRLEAAVERGHRRIADEIRTTLNQLNPRLSHLRTI
ncbi:MAG: hypothetical protein V3W41_01310 [Planctomycetota bacterium]